MRGEPVVPIAQPEELHYVWFRYLLHYMFTAIIYGANILTTLRAQKNNEIINKQNGDFRI